MPSLHRPCKATWKRASLLGIVCSLLACGEDATAYDGHEVATRGQLAPEAADSKACAEAPLHCHFLDGDTVINRQLADGIHPTAAGYTALGAAVYKIMQEDGMRR